MHPFPIVVLTYLLAAAVPARPVEPRLVDRPFLASLRTEAARRHPAAAAARLRETAADREIRGVRLWDDPSVGLAIMAADPDMRRGEGDIRLSFEQPLPKPGLYQANLSKAAASRRIAMENSRMTTLEIGAAAARDAVELALADESIRLESAQISWLQTMTENAREMTINPGTTSTDALRLESELAKENAILTAARRSRDGIAMRLNLRLDRPLDSVWPPLRLPDSPLPVPIATAEIARIPRFSPKVRALRETATAAGADVRIAETDRIPQFSVGVETSLYSGGDIRSAGVGLKMSLPVFNRRSYDARINASHLMENAAGRDVESARLEVAAAVVSATTEAANAASQAAAYAGPIRQRALDATNSVQAAWINSTAGLTDLLDSNRQLFSIRLEQRRFVAMQLAALEDLNLLVPHD